MYMSHHELDCLKGAELEWLPDNIIIGDGSAAHCLRQMVALAASSDSAILLTGSTGSGKTVAARAIHAASPRRNNPFVAVNAASLNGEHAIERLFGIAASGTECGRETLFRQAEGGTLYFDEIANLPLEIQALLEQWISHRLLPGISADAAGGFRIIAASSQCLASMIGAGSFRQDLFYHLSLLSIPIPPLRHRREDIPVLIDYFQMDKPAETRFIPESSALQLLSAYHWPGNIRELRNLVARACLFHPGQPVGTRRMGALLHMGQPTRTAKMADAIPPDSSAMKASFNLKAHLEQEEYHFIVSALRQAKGTVQHAADMSGVKRTTFIEKMKRHGINRRNFMQ